MIEDVQNKIKLIKYSVQQWAGRNKFIVRGAPFMILMVAASFGMENFARLRYDFRKNTVFEEKLKEAGVKATTIEEEYEKMQNEDLDTWENIRGPRPWEDSKAVQDTARQELKEKKMQTS